MMAEAAFQSDRPMQTPDAKVVPLHGPEHGAEIDFSRVEVDVAIEAFGASLQDPTLSAKRGNLLTISLNELLGQTGRPDDTSLAARLAEIIRAAQAFSKDSVYETKLARDPVFREIIAKVSETKGSRDQVIERRLLLRLAELRAEMSQDSSAHDQAWRDVKDRLFS